MARTGGFCGALSGGVMALGLIDGRSTPEDKVDRVYEQVQKLLLSFEEQFGSTNCAELTGGHLGTPKGQAHFKETGQHANCLNFAAAVTQKVLELAERKL